MLVASVAAAPKIELTVTKGKSKDREVEEVSLDQLIDVKGWKANGNRLSQHTVKKVKQIDVIEPKKPVKSEVVSEKPESKEVIESPDSDENETQELFEGPETKEKTEKPKKPAKAKPKKKPKDGSGGYDIGTTIELDF